MNQGRIWCVVSPTVGLPLFLGSVALTSLAVHYCVLSNTTWMKDFFQGGGMKTASMEDTVSPVALNAKAAPGFVVSVTPVSVQSDNGASFVVSVAPASPPVDSKTDALSVASLVPPVQN